MGRPLNRQGLFTADRGKAKSYRPALEVSAKLTDTLTANLSGAYRQAYINAPAQTPGLHIATGTKINDVPQHRQPVLRL
jgi:hypothetical protein